MSASLTKRLNAIVPKKVEALALGVGLAIALGQPDTAYELARGLAHMVRTDWKPGTQDEHEEGR
jgi:hypothetical protein